MAARVYLDWNATAPLRPEARAAMLAAMDAVGNPSSVHAEGRAARAIVETARRQIAALIGCDPAQIVFTSGATEANATVIARFNSVAAPATEHESIDAAIAADISKHDNTFRVDASGRIDVAAVEALYRGDYPTLGCISPASGET
ncbi:MAG: aminotransferase class V-fold PLP-dependent enzyme, partial [Pseudomonadota bacterium]